MAIRAPLAPIALLVAVSLSAAPHRIQVYPNASIRIQAIAEDPNGLLWLGTQDGLYRFNGLSYSRIAGHPFKSAEFLCFTGDGVLWIAGREGLVRYKGGFQILTHAPVRALAQSPGGLFAAISEETIARVILAWIDPAGRVTKYMEIHPEAGLTADSFGEIWFVVHAGGRNYAVRLNPRQPERSERIEIPEDFRQSVRDGRSRLWVADGLTATSVDPSSPRRLQRAAQGVNRPDPLMAGREGRVWFLGETIEELTTGLRFSDRQENAAYPPTAGLEDSKGRLWVAQAERGLVSWQIDPSWERWYRSDLGERAAAQVVRFGGHWIAVTHGGLLRLDEKSREWTAVAGAQDSYDSALVLSRNEMLATSRTQGLVRLEPDGHVVERMTNPAVPVRDFRAIARDGAGRIWVGNKHALLNLSGPRGSYRLKPESLPGAPQDAQAVDFQTDSLGHLWVGYENGLAWLDEKGVWRAIKTPGVDRVRSFALASDAIWVATRDADAFFKVTRQGDGWAVSRFAPDAGYGPADTMFLKRDSRGWIWRGTTDGVYVCDGVHFNPQDWLHLNASNGLASGGADIFGFFEDEDRSVWISGDQGITHFRPDASWFASPAGSPVAANVERAAGKVRVEMAAMELPLFRDFPWRYRTSSTDEWKYSRDGIIEFRSGLLERPTLEIAYLTGRSTLRLPFHSGFHWSWWWLALLAPALPAAGLRWKLGAGWLEIIDYRTRKLWFAAPRRVARAVKTKDSADHEFADLTGALLLDRFAVTRVEATGSLSTVYEGRDRRTGLKVAIKQLKGTGSLEPGKRMRDRFSREVAALRSVHHPNIVPVIETWVDADGNGCLVMPFLDGPTLRHAFAATIWPPPRVGRLVRAIGSALVEIHKRGIVHRDLKPENVILIHAGNPDEEPVLIDFGIAAMRAGRSELSVTRTFAGSLEYMAPEGLSGHYSPASDLFSLAVIALEALTGKRLKDFEAAFFDGGFAREVGNQLDGSLDGDRAAELAALLARAFDPIPKNRPQVGSWAQAVGNLLSDRA